MMTIFNLTELYRNLLLFSSLSIQPTNRLHLIHSWLHLSLMLLFSAVEHFVSSTRTTGHGE